MDVRETLLVLTLHVGPILKIYHSAAVCIVELTGHLLSGCDTTSSTGMGAAVNGNKRWEWEGNGNKTRLSLALGVVMRINHLEWEGIG